MSNRTDLVKRGLVSLLIAFSGLPAGCRRPPEPTAAPDGRRARLATVFIAARYPNGTATGSGFVAWRRGDEGLVATNRHVVVSEDGYRASEVEVVLNSGSGSERVLKADVAALDPDADLALLRVKGPDLPLPIDPRDAEVPVETVPVRIHGFPFGVALGGGKTPEITIGSGSVSSLRRDDTGRVFALQLDGDLNPGNSGGPVTTPEGRLVGISVARVRQSGIGFAIPAAALAAMLDGRPVALRPEEVRSEDGPSSFSISADLLDPLGAVSDVEILAGAVSAQPGAPRAGADHRYPELAFVSARAPLARREGSASGAVNLEAAAVDTDYYLQIRFRNGRDQTLFTEPLVVTAHVPRSIAPAPTGALARAAFDSDGRFSAATERGGSLPAPATLEAPDTYVRLPGPVEGISIAGAGRYVVLKLASIGALGVFDVEIGALVRMIPIPSRDFLHAAGGDVALTAFNENGLLTTWSLATGERIASRESPFKGRFVDIAMGSANEGLALVLTCEGTAPLSRVQAGLLDVSALAPQVTTSEEARAIGLLSFSFREELRIAADAGFSAITASQRRTSLWLLSRQAGSFRTRSSWDYQVIGLPGDDGRVYTEAGDILTRDLVSTAKLRGSLLPGGGGAFFLVVGEGGSLDVFQAGTTTRIGSAGRFPGTSGTEGKNDPFDSPSPLHQRAFFDGSRMKVVFVTQDREALVLRSLDLRRMLEGLGKSYLIPYSTPPVAARRGTLLAYRIQVLSKPLPVTFRLEFGPPGMDVSPDGLVTWNVPRSAEFGEPQDAMAVVTLRNDAGDESFHNLRLSLE